MEQRNEMNDKKKLKLIHEYGSTRLFSWVPESSN